VHLTLRQMEVLAAAARTGSYTRAAQVLHLTQPAVSMQIRQLEEQAGLPLFEPVGRGVALTDAGRALLDYAQRIIALVEEADEVITAMRGGNRGRLSLAVASTANQFASRILAAFVAEHPGVTVSLEVTNRETVLKRLVDNVPDLAVMGEVPAELGLVAEPFMANPLVVIAATDHPLRAQAEASGAELPLATVIEEPFVVRERGSGTRSAMERLFRQRGIKLKAATEMSENEAIKQAVAAGLGLGLVSQHTLELELATGRLAVLPVEGFPIERQWFLVHRRGKYLSPVAHGFRRFVLEQARSFVAVSAVSRAGPT